MTGSPPLPPLPPEDRAALGLPDAPAPVSPGPAASAGGFESRAQPDAFEARVRQAQEATAFTCTACGERVSQPYHQHGRGFSAAVPEPAAAPAAEPLKSVSPGPATNVPTFENRVTVTVGGGREAIRHAGDNATSAGNLFEQRVSPQDGQH